MISSLRLQNFRSYADKTFDFDAGANIIVGPNAIGKTNIVEAILISCKGYSYRAKDIDLIAFNRSWARLDCYAGANKRTIKINKNQNPAKTFYINGHLYKRLPLSMKLPVVLFEPNNLQMLNGPPEGRRSYLDGFIEQINPEYGQTLRKYLRALAQRNSLLKNHQTPSSNLLFPWNIRISQLGGQIVVYRSKFIEEINKTLPSIYADLSASGIKTTVLYKPQLSVEDYETNYLKKLESDVEDDLRSGFTLFGPHRDDFQLFFGKHPSSTYASRGELRTATLALKITEFESLKHSSQTKPIILLDDVYSELDIARRKALTNFLSESQSFITSTDADVVLKQFSRKRKVFKL